MIKSKEDVRINNREIKIKEQREAMYRCRKLSWVRSNIVIKMEIV